MGAKTTRSRGVNFKTWCGVSHFRFDLLFEAPGLEWKTASMRPNSSWQCRSSLLRKSRHIDMVHGNEGEARHHFKFNQQRSTAGPRALAWLHLSTGDAGSRTTDRSLSTTELLKSSTPRAELADCKTTLATCDSCLGVQDFFALLDALLGLLKLLTSCQ